MNSKLDKRLYIGLIIIFLSLAGNILYAKSRELRHPVFFEHYYEIPMDEHGNNWTNLYYLMNVNDSREIMDISIPNLNGRIRFSIGNTNGNQYRYYQIKEVNLIMAFDEESYSKMDDNVVIENATIVFNNGEQMEVDLGKIVLKKQKYDNQFLDHSMSSSSSRNTSKEIYKLEKPIIIHSITSDLLEEAKGLVNMRIISDNPELGLCSDLDIKEFERRYMDSVNRDEEVQLLPFEDIRVPLSADSSLQIYTGFDIKDKKKSYNFYRIMYSLNYETMDGEKGNAKLRNVIYTPYFSDKDIRNFLESRGI